MGFERWLLSRFVSPNDPADSTPVLGTTSLAQLEGSLRACMKRHSRYFRFSFGLAVLLALTAVVVAALGGSAGGQWFQTALGISSLGTVVFAINQAREEQTFELMLELAIGLDENALREVLRVMLQKYAAGQSVPAVLLSTRSRSTSPTPPPATESKADPAQPKTRDLLNEALRTDSDLDAFCQDYFERVYNNWSKGMDRQTKLNDLFQKVDKVDILLSLVRFTL